MKNINKLSISILVFLIIYLVLNVSNDINLIHYNKNLNILYLFSLFIFVFVFSYKEHKIGLGTKESTKKVIYYLGITLLIYFLFGLISSYSYNVFNFEIQLVINNILYLLIPLLILEYLRYYIITHRSNKKAFLIVITVLIILININYRALLNLNSNKEIYIYIFHNLLPLISKNIILTFITMKMGLYSSLAYQLIYLLFMLFIPILPNLGYYISSIILTSIPIIVYRFANKTNEVKYFKITKENKVLSVLFYVFILLIICFNFGLFKYKPVAVMSKSMDKVFNRGSLVIYEGIGKNSKLKIGDIIIFNKNKDIYIHRINKVISKNKKNYYVTKGDSNGSVDNGTISIEDIDGKYVFSIPYIGYPSVIINEILKN